MARLQITDLNSSDSASREELTEEELLEINGGSWLTWLVGSALIVGGILTAGTGLGGVLITVGGSIITSEPSFP